MQSLSCASFLIRLVYALVFLTASAASQCVVVGSVGGSGCGVSTPFGIPRVTCNSQPVLGNAAFAVDAAVPCPASAGILLIGACLPQAQVIRGPFGFGGFCGPTESVCALFVDPQGAIAISGFVTPGGYSFPLPIPNDPGLAGLRLCAQQAGLCSFAQGSCIHASHGMQITL